MCRRGIRRRVIPQRRPSFRVANSPTLETRHPRFGNLIGGSGMQGSQIYGRPFWDLEGHWTAALILTSSPIHHTDLDGIGEILCRLLLTQCDVCPYSTPVSKVWGSWSGIEMQCTATAFSRGVEFYCGQSCCLPCKCWATTSA